MLLDRVVRVILVAASALLPPASLLIDDDRVGITGGCHSDVGVARAREGLRRIGQRLPDDGTLRHEVAVLRRTTAEDLGARPRPVTTTTKRRDREVQLLSSAAARRKPLDRSRARRDDRWVPSLVGPTVVVRESFLAAMREFADEGRAGDDTMVGRDLREWGGRWETDEGFEAYVAAVVRDQEEDAPRQPGWVPCTTLWWVDRTTYLGRIAIRHRLTPRLRDVGGHIGYDVRRSARRRGHATAMLAAALPAAHCLGIDPALVTCDDTNLWSRRVIEANGGVFEDQRGPKLRYWVPTSRRGVGATG